jgi:hypothetical protein
MATAEESVVIRAPCEAVYEYRLNLDNLPRYNPDVSELYTAAGCTRFRVRLLPGLRYPCRLTVPEAVRPSRIRFSIDSMFRAEELCTITPRGGGTELRLQMEIATPGGQIGRLIDRAFVVPTATRQIRRELALMKAQLEARAHN